MPREHDGEMTSEQRTTYAGASYWFSGVVDRVGRRWDEPGLGEWSVRDLVGHTSRALLTVETYLSAAREAPDTPLDLVSAADYLVASRVGLADPAAVAQRGRDAGAALGPDPAAAVHEIVDRVLALVTEQSGDAMVATPVGGMLLDAYLPGRVFELAVHGADLAHALGVTMQPPEPAVASALELGGHLAARSGTAGEVLRALTGRQGLRAGFTVL